jgi:hypothetical protein
MPAKRAFRPHKERILPYIGALSRFMPLLRALARVPAPKLREMPGEQAGKSTERAIKWLMKP